MKIPIIAWKAVKYISFSLAAGIFIVTFYVNHYMPRGPIYGTGEYNCNESSGRCEEDTIEDTRNLNIPDWAKAVKGHDSGDSNFIYIIGLVILGMYADANTKEQKKE